MPEGQLPVEEVDVAVTKLSIRSLLCLIFLGYCPLLMSAVLPDDKVETLYHSYSGGGVEVTGPSVLVRKKFLDDFSVSANYYVDMVSSASIDVVTSASAYSEERTQYLLGLDYLNNNSRFALNYVNSSESDYEANTASFKISQDFFSNLTNLAIGYSKGWDTVKKNGQSDFSKDANRQNFRVDLTQVITKDFFMVLAVEAVTDEGFLNNPYRSVRYLDPTVVLGYSYQPELYPNTRTSSAVSISGRYFLPYQAVIRSEYRWYQDTWGIDAQNIELGYIQPYNDRLTLETNLRYYNQNQADFYADLFPFQNAQNFLARDKELSAFHSISLGLGANYHFPIHRLGFDKGRLSLFYNYFKFNYKNFHDLRVVTTPGEEPLYQFDADVLRFTAVFLF